MEDILSFNGKCCLGEIEYLLVNTNNSAIFHRAWVERNDDNNNEKHSISLTINIKINKIRFGQRQRVSEDLKD